MSRLRLALQSADERYHSAFLSAPDDGPRLAQIVRQKEMLKKLRKYIPPPPWISYHVLIEYTIDNYNAAIFAAVKSLGYGVYHNWRHLGTHIPYMGAPTANPAGFLTGRENYIDIVWPFNYESPFIGTDTRPMFQLRKLYADIENFVSPANIAALKRAWAAVAQFMAPGVGDIIQTKQ